MQEKYRDKIFEIRVEGHTDTVPAPTYDPDPYIDNMILSQLRSVAVLKHFRRMAYYNTLSKEDEKRLQFWLTANGLSFGRTLDRDKELTLVSGLTPHNTYSQGRIQNCYNQYQFERLKQKMDEMGFPQIESRSGFRIIRTDFEDAYNAGKISFDEDGIYFDLGGERLKGYVFIREYQISYKGPEQLQLPKFHLIKCITDDFISQGDVRHRYDWSNKRTNDLVDIASGENREYLDVELESCENFARQIEYEGFTTIDFFDMLEEEAVELPLFETDIDGYVRGWERIRQQYRTEVEFTCEECQVKIETRVHRRYLHVHHIDGNKTN